MPSNGVLVLPPGVTYKVGRPYKIAGIWYYPAEDYAYSQKGTASWYGSDFHGKRTANGEIYDMNDLTAAHPTLPLPSIVRVTNLENNRTVILRINDRGPFKRNRIIDVSRRGAQLLGFYEAGTTRVRVEIDSTESLNIKNLALGRNPGAMPRVISAPRTTVDAVELPPPPLAPPEAVPGGTPGPVQIPIAPNAVGITPKKLPVQAVSADIPTSGLFVQAGAFSEESNALRLAQQLDEFGEAFVMPIVVDGVQYFRVRLGPFDDEDAAAQLLAQVRSYGYGDAQVVRN
jgi:rare lipoprotein A